MSLLFVDLAYLGIKSIYSIGYYTVKYSYNTIAYLSGNEYIVDKEVVDTNELVLKELKELRKEIAILKCDNEEKCQLDNSKKAFIEDMVLLSDDDNTTSLTCNYEEYPDVDI